MLGKDVMRCWTCGNPLQTELLQGFLLWFPPGRKPYGQEAEPPLWPALLMTFLGKLLVNAALTWRKAWGIKLALSLLLTARKLAVCLLTRIIQNLGIIWVKLNYT